METRTILYNYPNPNHTKEDDELSVKKGDVVTIISQIDDWFECSLEGKIGIVPSNIVSSKSSKSSKSNPTAPSVSASSLFSLATTATPTPVTTNATPDNDNDSDKKTRKQETTTITASSLVSTSLVTTSEDRNRSSTSDSSYAQGERLAAALVSTIASNERVQQAASLAKTGIVVATNKVRSVSTQMQASYKVGRDKATAVTGRGSRSDTAESKESAVNYVADILESDTTKAALIAGAHVAAAFAGSKVGMTPATTSLAAASAINAGVDIVQDASVGVAKVTVNAISSVVPDGIGIVSGVTYAMGDTALRESTGAINGIVNAVSSRLRTTSGRSNVDVDDRSGGEKIDESRNGLEFEVMESSSSEESGEDVSDMEDFE